MAACQPDRDRVQKELLDAAESCEARITCALHGAVSCNLGRDLLCKCGAGAGGAHVHQHLQHKLQKFAASD